MNTEANATLGSWSFFYLSEDGNGHQITIHAPTYDDAVAIFERTAGAIPFISKAES
jgi:hypothetical protein